MDLAELRKEPHLSASSIGQYVDCSLAYKFSKIDRVKAEFLPDSMLFGSAVHKALEEYYYEKLEGNDPGLEELVHFFRIFWIKEARDNLLVKYSNNKSFEILLQDGISLLTAYHKQKTDDKYRILALEEPFSFKIDGVPVPVIGVLDLLEEDESGTIIITDWKTAGKAYSTNDIDSSLQLTLYYMAMKANGYRDREIILKFDVLVKTKQPKFEQYYATRTETDTSKLSKKIRTVWEGITKEVFIPNDTSWKCHGCLYKKHCEDWFQQ